MRCPECGANVAPKIALCPKCDHVLDASAFSSAPPISRGDQDTPPEGTPVPAPRAARPPVRNAQQASRRPAPRLDDEDTHPRPRGAREDDDPDTGEIEEEEDWHPKPVAVPPRASTKATANDSIGSGYAPAEDLAQEAKFFLRDLRGGNLLAFWGGALTFLSSFFPWKQTAAEGDVLGFMSIAAPVLLLSLLLCGSILVRERNLMPRASAATTWYLQFACAALIPLWTIACIKLSWNSVLVRATVGVEDIWTSKPGFGAIIALPLSVLALAGTLLGMKGKG
jgi:hypothetical protein